MESVSSPGHPDPDESFSFSCYDYNSDLAVFSEDINHGSDDDDAESYIEIALDNGDCEGEPEEFELRISLSSTHVSFPQFSAHSLTAIKLQENPCFEADRITETPSSSSSTSTFTCSSSTGSCGLDTSLKTADRESCHPHENRLALIDISQRELVQNRPSRKTSTNTKAISDSITRLLIKFRGIKVQTLLASIVKPRQDISSEANGENKKKQSKGTIHYYHRLIKPFDKWLVQRNQQGKGRNANANDSDNSFGSGEKYRRVLEINLDAVRGVIEAMRIGIGRKDKEARSCPTSVNSSPVHKGLPSESKLHARDNSIQAAIAHCKK